MLERFYRIVLLTFLVLAPARAFGQIFVSTGGVSGLRMYQSGSNDWWLDPSAGRLDIKANGVLVSSIGATGSMWVSGGITVPTPTASNQVATKGYVDAAGGFSGLAPFHHASVATSGSGSFVAPSTATFAEVTMCGGGGGGGSVGSNGGNAGGGGGGGGFKGFCRVIGGESYSYSIGAGGTAGSGVGGNTTFAACVGITAYGGRGGVGTTSTTSGSFPGGVPGGAYGSPGGDGSNLGGGAGGGSLNGQGAAGGSGSAASAGSCGGGGGAASGGSATGGAGGSGYLRVLWWGPL